MSTLAISQNFNPQSIAWDVAGALWAILRTLALLLAGGAALALVFAVVATIPSTVWLSVAVTLIFALATYPRSKAAQP